MYPLPSNPLRCFCVCVCFFFSQTTELVFIQNAVDQIWTIFYPYFTKNLKKKKKKIQKKKISLGSMLIVICSMVKVEGHPGVCPVMSYICDNVKAPDNWGGRKSIHFYFSLKIYLFLYSLERPQQSRSSILMNTYDIGFCGEIRQTDQNFLVE